MVKEFRQALRDPHRAAGLIPVDHPQLAGDSQGDEPDQNTNSQRLYSESRTIISSDARMNTAAELSGLARFTA